MKSKLASTVKKRPEIPEVEFVYHKHYMPENKLEQLMTNCLGFKHITEKAGLYCAHPDKHTKVFAVEFIPGHYDFPFLNHVDNCAYKDGFIFLGLDIKSGSFFMPII